MFQLSESHDRVDWRRSLPPTDISMEWCATYSVGITEIDSHHKQLLHLTSEVVDAIVSNQGWATVHYSIVQARQFARFHFWFEEALMRLYGYMEVHEHTAAHRQILGQLERIEGSILHAEEAAGLFRTFRGGLLDHIQHADRAYARHILMGAAVIAS